ncbi:MAG: 30S ribosomal protein S8 [Candidatus Heimdallarchaeota archaeon]|nr:30S ribosomal protein S8 [Candidatus Heimdallarchaeota archaeon]
MLMDPLADALSKIRGYEDRGRKEVILTPSSNLIENVLATLQKASYLGEVERIEDGRGGKFKVQLLGRINKCAVVRPRYPIKQHEFAKWEKHYLPAANFGILVLTTPEGVMSQIEAHTKGIGGRILAYVY